MSPNFVYNKGNLLSSQTNKLVPLGTRVLSSLSMLSWLPQHLRGDPPGTSRRTPLPETPLQRGLCGEVQLRSLDLRSDQPISIVTALNNCVS